MTNHDKYAGTYAMIIENATFKINVSGEVISDRVFKGGNCFMKYIVIDLEMNPIAVKHEKERKISKLEVIQIGAVLLDEKYLEIGSFVTLVKPQYNERIEPKYERLTGIKTGMVDSAPCFQEALSMFLSWCDSIRDEIQIIQWSENDLAQIVREIKLKEITISERNEKYLNSGWVDFQAEYGTILGMERKISLKDAVMYAGENFQGHQHDALVDARNTAELVSVVRDDVRCKEALGAVIDALKPEKEVSLGDLFDFSKLVLVA